MGKIMPRPGFIDREANSGLATCPTPRNLTLNHISLGVNNVRNDSIC